MLISPQEIVELQLILQPLLGGFSIGEIDVEEHKVLVVSHDGPVLIIEAFHAQSESHTLRFFSGKEPDSAAAFLIARGEVGVVSRDALQLRRNLVLSGLGLLEAEYIRPVLHQPVEEAFLKNGSQAVHIPGEGSPA